MVGLIFFSCKKEPSQIGLNVVGENPLNVLFTDTTSVKVYSVLRDSVRTDYLANSILGVVVDPIFGTTKASLYVQYDLTIANYSFGEQQSFDSLVLTIPYQNVSVYGDSMAPLSFNVYELNEKLILDTAYYSNQTAEFLPELLGSATFIPKPYDSVWVDTNYVEPHFTLRLSDELGQRLISLDDTMYYVSEDFTESFNGLYFEPVYTGGTGNLTFLNMRGTGSTLTLHYNNSVSDSLSYSFAVGSYSPSFQNYDHMDYAGSDPDFYRQVIEKDTLAGNQKFYMQTLGGVDSYISFPSLFDREDFSKFAINEAKLVVTNVDPDNMFMAPANMVMFQKRYSDVDSTENYYYIEDASGGDAYFDGYYNSTTKQYEIRITNYLQDYIAGKFESDEILMQIMGATYNGSRLIGGGSNPDINPESRIRLEIIYTEIETDNQ